jgi:hypothetical protein
MNQPHALLRLVAVLTAVTLLAGGCAASPGSLDRFLGVEAPPFNPVNYRGDSRLPADLHRVAVLPVCGGALAGPEAAAALDAVLVEELQRQMRFEVVVVSREDCRRLFGASEYSSVGALPHGFLDRLAARYAVDAVLFTDITVYRPYQPLSIGLRAKLAAVRDVRLVWAFDEVFSATDPGVQTSVRQAAHAHAGAALTDPVPAVLQSPARFGAVAAGIMFATLPPR